MSSEYLEKMYKALKQDIKEGNLKNIRIHSRKINSTLPDSSIEYYNPKGIEQVDIYGDEYGYSAGVWKSDTAYVKFNVDCKTYVKGDRGSRAVDGKSPSFGQRVSRTHF